MLKAVNGFISSGRERNHDNEYLDPDHKLKVNSSSNMHEFAEDRRDHDARSGGSCGGGYEGLGMPLRPQMHSQEERWWHLPDSIQDVLPLPKRFEFHLEVLPYLDSVSYKICTQEICSCIWPSVILLNCYTVHKSFNGIIMK